MAAVLGVLLVAAAGRAGNPVVAVFDPDKSDRVTLLEARLLAEPGLTLVERADVEKALKEQELQAAFGPQGVGSRVKLGAVLKADVLVLVRKAAGAKEPTLDVVVCETAGGLRLIRQAVPVTADAAADAAALLDAARAGVRKWGERVTGVVAVPPFASRDLGREADYLKAAFAKLAEQAAAGRPGAVAVELAEAEAVSAELRLAAPGAVVARPLPLYLLGDYRHDGAGDARRVTLTLRAERGGKPVGEVTTVTAKPDEAATAVRTWAARVAAGAGPAPADPKAEARRLAELARGFRRTGDWAEAVALIEAGMLLDPGLAELHVDYLRATGPPIAKLWKQSAWQQDAAATDLYLRLYCRGLEHLEAFVAGGGTCPATSMRPSGGI